MCGIRDIVLDIGKYECLVLGTMSLIPKVFSCYYQAFIFKLELIEIDFLQENKSIMISIVLSNSHDNYRLNWNDLDAN